MNKRLIWSILGGTLPFAVWGADKVGGDGLALAVAVAAFLGPWLWCAPWWKE